MKSFGLGLFLALASITAGAAEDAPPRAARSVHFGWVAPEAQLFTTSMVIDQSTPGSYFMACGWSVGYFGIQELGNGKKVILFSVWDPTKGDDPGKVSASERVETLYSDPSVRIKRFGGEGTGGQCMGEFPWKLGETNRFLVRAIAAGEKTSYAGYVFDSDKKSWRHLATFRVRTGGQLLKGMYSFVEDFRRDTRSATEARKARFADGWVQTAKGDWIALTRGRFTASSASWEARETINAGLDDNWFFLQTGGDTRQEFELRNVIEKSPLSIELPKFDLEPAHSGN
jgi:hypothetical protein